MCERGMETIQQDLEKQVQDWSEWAAANKEWCVFISTNRNKIQSPKERENYL